MVQIAQREYAEMTIDTKLLKAWGIPGFMTDEELHIADMEVQALVKAFSDSNFQLGIMPMVLPESEQTVPILCLVGKDQFFPIAQLLSHKQNADARIRPTDQLPGHMH